MNEYTRGNDAAFPNPMVMAGYGQIPANTALPGMTMREWYAGMALHSLMANGNAINEPGGVAWLAKVAFAIADAMLAEVKKEPQRD